MPVREMWPELRLLARKRRCSPCSERRSQHLASQPAKSCSPGGLTRAGMSDASKVGAPPGRGRSDSLADKTDRFGEQCGWLRDPECGQPKGKR